MAATALAEKMRAQAKKAIERYGEEVTVTRKNADGTVTTFTAQCRPQALTPTFVHRINNEAMQNLEENDQHDFVFAGDVTILDLDVILQGGYEWDVSSASEQTLAGVIVTWHALSVKRKVVDSGL